MGAAGTELDRLYYTIDFDTTKAAGQLRGLEDAAKGAGGSASKHLRQAGDAAQHLHRGVEVSRRELMYFGRELATGDFARLPSTLVLIATHMSGITTTAILMGIAIAGPFALMGTAALAAGHAIERVNMAIASTGNAAGVTRGQVSSMVQQIAASGSMSTRGALDVSGKLLGGGNIPGSALRSGVEATDAFSKMTGGNLDKSADAISAMMADPAKAAKQLHEQFKLLSDAEMVRIMGLKDRTAQELAIFEALKTRGDKVEDSMWSLSKAFDKFGENLSNFWHRTGMFFGGGQGQESTQQKYEAAKREADSLEKLRAQSGGIISAGQVARARARQGDFHYQMGVEANSAKAAADQKAKDDAAALARGPGAMEIRRLADEIKVSLAPMRDREGLSARLAAGRQFDVNSGNPDMAQFAGGIRSGTVAAAQAGIAGRRADTLLVTQQSAAAEEALAHAFQDSAAAGERQEALNTALAEKRKGAIDDENAYAAALMQSAAAHRQIAAARKDADLGGEVALARLENSLVMAGRDVRERELAQLRMKNELIQEGWDLTTSAGAAELEKRKAITDAMQDQLVVQRDLADTQERQMSVANDLTSIFEKAIQGGNALKQILPDVSRMILSLGVMNPLKNAISQGITGEKGNLPTMKDLGSLLGGNERGHSPYRPMYVHVVNQQAGGGVGSEHMAGIVAGIADARINKAIPSIHTSAVDAVSQAVGRGLLLGGGVI